MACEWQNIEYTYRKNYILNITLYIEMINHSPANTDRFPARKSIITAVEIDIARHEDPVVWMS